MQLNNEQAVRWISELERSLEQFDGELNKMDFISQQYDRLHLLVRAIDGSVIFLGTTPLGELHG